MTDGLWAPNGAREWLMDFLFPLVVILWFNHETPFWGEFWHWPVFPKRPVFYIPMLTVFLPFYTPFYLLFPSPFICLGDYNITGLQLACYRRHCVHLSGFRATEGGRSLFQVVPNSVSGLARKPQQFFASPLPMIRCTKQASPRRMNWLHQT